MSALKLQPAGPPSRSLSSPPPPTTSNLSKSTQPRGDGTRVGSRTLWSPPAPALSKAQSGPNHCPSSSISNSRNTGAAYPSQVRQACMCTRMWLQPPCSLIQTCTLLHSLNKALSTCSGLDPVLGPGDRGGRSILGSCYQMPVGSEGRRMLMSHYCTRPC